MTGNVLVEMHDEHGNLVDSVRSGNTITATGKEWAIRKLRNGTDVNTHKLKDATMQVNLSLAGGAWVTLTKDTTLSTLSGAVGTLVGTHTFAGANRRFVSARLQFPTNFQEQATPITIAEYTLPKAFVGKVGGTITMTWTLRLSYNAANDYDDTEVSRVRESVGGSNTRQLWLRATDVPNVENKLMAILWDSTTANPSAIRFGQVRMFEIDTSGLTDDELDELGDAGPFPIIQEDPLIAGTFALNVTDTSNPRLDFSFSWAGVGSDSGVKRKRWFFMTMGATAQTANSIRWMAGSHLESDDIPAAATTYTTGITIR